MKLKFKEPLIKSWRIIIAVVFFSAICLQSTLLNAQDVEKKRLNDQELQWVLGVSDVKWKGEVKSLARLFEDKKYEEADALLDDWLVRDFNQAVLSLPTLSPFVFHYKEHSFAPVFAKYFNRFKGFEKINTLAMLGLENVSVRYVAFSVMKIWWREDQAGMTQWIKQTPGFFEQTYLEGLMESVLLRREDYPALASVFFSLSPLDDRRLSYFTQVIEHWLKEDLDGPSNYLLGFYEDADKNIQSDLAFDEAVSRLCYRYANEKRYSEALTWASRIKSAEVREWGVRDYAYNVVNEAEKQLFLNWIVSNPFQIPAALQQIEEHFNSIDTKDAEDPAK